MEWVGGPIEKYVTPSCCEAMVVVLAYLAACFGKLVQSVMNLAFHLDWLLF